MLRQENEAEAKETSDALILQPMKVEDFKKNKKSLNVAIAIEQVMSITNAQLLK